MKTKSLKVIPITFDTYFAVIKNSVGSKFFRNFYADIGGKKTDILQNGVRSCARFVSSLLYLSKLLKDVHATVDGTVKDLKQSGWKQVKNPKTGSVLMWEAMDCGNNEFHKHLGFYIGNGKAISTSSNLKCPIVHHWTFGVKNGRPVREIEKIFWHKKLNI